MPQKFFTAIVGKILKGDQKESYAEQDGLYKRQKTAPGSCNLIEPPALGKKTQASSGLMFSSMAMSLNSLDSPLRASMAIRASL